MRINVCHSGRALFAFPKRPLQAHERNALHVVLQALQRARLHLDSIDVTAFSSASITSVRIFSKVSSASIEVTTNM